MEKNTEINEQLLKSHLASLKLIEDLEYALRWAAGNYGNLARDIRQAVSQFRKDGLGKEDGSE